MVLRRTSVGVIGLVLVLTVIKMVITSPVPPLANYTPARLTTSMGAALLKAGSITLSASYLPNNESGTVTADQNGDYDVRVQSSVNASLISELRVIHGNMYFRYSATPLEGYLTTYPDSLSGTVSGRDVTTYANKWFRTGEVATSTLKAPTTPTSVRGFFNALGLAPSEAIKEVATTNDGVTVVPLDTGDATWFIAASGPRLPNALSAIPGPSTSPIPFLVQSVTVGVSYPRDTLTAPAKVLHVPANFAAAWNANFPAHEVSSLTPFSLLYIEIASPR
jgi:hypothetical protein